MAYETPPHGRHKTRSASICAPASGSLETILNPPSGSGTPESGTPGYQRRRPATRTQSARITGARSVRIFTLFICYVKYIYMWKHRLKKILNCFEFTWNCT